MRNRLFLCLFVTVTLGLVAVMAQDITGGGSLVRDITGGVALIFRAPQNPVVQTATGGGRVKPGRKPAPVRKQDPIIAKANAARSAPKPRYDEAEQQYQLAAQIAPDDARAFAGLGNVYVDQGKFAQAVDAYQKAIKVKPDYNGAYLPLAFSLARLDRYPEAIDIYKEALKRDSTSPEIFNNLSFAYNHSGHYQEAVEASQQAIKLLGETGEAYKGLKRYDEAATALKKSSEIEPTNAAAHFNLGLTLYNAGRYSEAIESYKEVIK